MFAVQDAIRTLLRNSCHVVNQMWLPWRLQIQKSLPIDDLHVILQPTIIEHFVELTSGLITADFGGFANGC